MFKVRNHIEIRDTGPLSYLAQSLTDVPTLLGPPLNMSGACAFHSASTATTLATHMPSFLSWTMKRASYLAYLYLLSTPTYWCRQSNLFPKHYVMALPSKPSGAPQYFWNINQCLTVIWTSHCFLSHPTSSHSPGPTALQPGLPQTCHVSLPCRGVFVHMVLSADMLFSVAHIHV